jgi:serine/threonine protein kinase
MVMERLTGESLKARLLRGRVTTAELLGIATQLASALQVIHAVGLVHQDIKPANVYVARKGTVKVLDFGIATWIGAASEGMAAARPGLRAPVLGSANYISPDRILRRPADPRSDLFSFGVVLYEMATGHLPFSAPSLAEMVLNVLEARPMTVRSLAPERPSALGDIVHRLLARGAEERYQSAGAVLRDLRRVPVEDSGRARRAVTVH